MKETREKISAFMDTGLEGNELIDEIYQKPELKGVWGRYHLIGECLRGKLPRKIHLQFADQLSKQLQREGLPPTKKRQTSPSSIHRWIKPIAGFAIAASFTAAIIIGVQQHLIDDGTGTHQVIAVQPGQQDLQMDLASYLSTASDTAKDSTQTEILPEASGYLVDYHLHRSNSGIKSILPYVHIVGYEAESDSHKK